MCRPITCSATCSALTSLPSLTPAQKSWGEAMVITALVIGVLALAIHFNLDFQRAWQEKVVPLLRDPGVRIPATLITGITSILCVSFLIHRCSLPSVKQMQELPSVKRARELYLEVDKGSLDAKDKLMAAATEGDLYAQVFLARIYYLGTTVSKDKGEALKWFEKAAAQGYGDAQGVVGEMYFHGHGVKPDKKVAAQWWEKAAVQGNADAQVALAKMYREGDGVEPDNKKAEGWFRKAAAQGNTNAKNALTWIRREAALRSAMEAEEKGK